MRPVHVRIVNNIRNPLRLFKWTKVQLSHETDVFLSTLPSSGTHWLRFLVAKGIVDAYDLDYEFTDIHPHEVVPPFRNKNLYSDFANRNEVPRVQHSHKSYSLLYRGSRVIVLVRDLRDTMASSYDTYSARIDPSITFSEFLRADGVDGTRHRTLSHRIKFLNRWYQNFEKLEDHMVIRYEDLKKDTIEKTKEIYEFIGIENITNDLIRDAVRFSSLDHMKYIEEHGEANIELIDNDQKLGTTDTKGQKINEGSTNRYKEYFDNDDMRYFKESIEKNLIHDFGYDYFNSISEN